MKKIIIVFLFLSQLGLTKTLSATPLTHITKIGGYTEYGGGDIILEVEEVALGCESGFWIGAEDPGLNSILSILLSAKYTQTKVVLHGDKDRYWAGSSKRKYCHLYMVK